jgi:two-component system OmpR family sensor kinase
VALVLATVAVAQLINLLLLASLSQAPSRATPVYVLGIAIKAGNNPGFLYRTIPAQPRRDLDDGPAAAILEEELARELGRAPEDIVVDLGRVQNGKLVQVYVKQAGQEAEPKQALLGHFRVGVRREGGGWLLVEPRDRGLFDSRERRFLLLFLLSALAMLPAAWAFARRLALPFEQLADAAERLGRDPNAPPPSIEGPAEVGRAADAFRQMQERLQAYVADRTKMLGAIAHDMRTPLTRLAFRLESVEGPKRAAMAADIAEMEAMVAATMGLVRSEAQPADRQRLELGSIVEKVADDMALVGRPVSAQVDDMLVVDGDPAALRRLFTNLFDNGVSYGKRVSARAWRDGDMAVVDLDDEGPGLPPGEAERVFEPFYRLETSRNRETGGIGLGLSLVRSTARAHGGDVVLENRPGGGLRARVTLPLAS